MSLHFQSSIVKEVTIQENVKTDLISGHLGAEITGINLAEPTPLQIDYINKAWLDHKVLVFRNQKITREQHIEFGRNFGNLEILIQRLQSL